MNSPWWWAGALVDGSLGRRAARGFVAVLALVSLVHPALAEWFFRGLVQYRTHELMQELQPVLHGIQHIHVVPAHPALRPR